MSCLWLTVCVDRIVTLTFPCQKKRKKSKTKKLAGFYVEEVEKLGLLVALTSESLRTVTYLGQNTYSWQFDRGW